MSKRYGCNFVVDLLLLVNINNNYHYVPIEDLCKMVMFVRKQPFGEQNEICRKRFHICTSSEIMKNHHEMCYNTKRLTIKMSKPNNNQKVFKNLRARWCAPRVIYFDLESIIVPVESIIVPVPGPACTSATSHTQTVEIHKPCSYGLVVVEHGTSTPIKYEMCRGPDAMKKLIKSLESIAKEIYNDKTKNTSPL